MGKSTTSASFPFWVSTDATAQCVVPRSMPTTYEAKLLLHPDVQLQLPAPLAAATFEATQLQLSELGHRRLQVHRDELAFLAALGGEVRLHRRELLQLGHVLHPAADLVLAAQRRREEAELRGMAHEEPELLGRNIRLRPFL